MQNITFNYKDKPIKIRVKQTSNVFHEAKGLILTKREKAKALLFNLKKPMAIHSFFVFFPFIAVWLDKDNKVIEMKRVKPFTPHVKPKKKFKKLIEIPINKRYSKVLSTLYNS